MFDKKKKKVPIGSFNNVINVPMGSLNEKKRINYIPYESIPSSLTQTSFNYSQERGNPIIKKRKTNDGVVVIKKQKILVFSHSLMVKNIIEKLFKHIKILLENTIDKTMYSFFITVCIFF